MNYLQQLRAGRVTYDDLDLFCQNWYDNALCGGETKMLHEYLGMTITEYNKVKLDRNYLSELKYGPSSS